MYRYLLPIGTVVKTAHAEQPLMIMGLLQKDKDGKLYDYSAVLFPEGFLDARLSVLFQHSEIESILHRGLDNEQHKAFTYILSAMAAAEKESSDEDSPSEQQDNKGES